MPMTMPKNRESSDIPFSGWLYADPSFVDPRAPAGRAFARLRQLVIAEHESALPAPCGVDDDVMTGRPGRSDHVPEILLDLAAFQSKLAGNRRRCPRFQRDSLEQVPSKCHGQTVEYFAQSLRISAASRGTPVIGSSFSVSYSADM